MFNKEELEYLYTAVNMMPPPNTTQGGKAKAYMINKLCDLMDELEKPNLKVVEDEITDLMKPKAAGEKK